MNISDIKDFFINLDEQTTINLIIAIVIIAVFDILSPLFSYVIIKVFNYKSKKENIKQNAFYIPLKSFFKILGLYVTFIFLKPTLNYGEDVTKIVTKIFKVIVILTTATGLARSLTVKSRFIKRFKAKSEKEIDDSSINFIIRIVKSLIYIVAGFMIIAEFGYDLSGLVTGLGLGSVVVTLAAQDTIKNLFGGVMIFLDKPFKVGDFIEFDSMSGNVEDITFRSTKIRTLDDTIAQIPNSEISSKVVVNISKVRKRRYVLNLGFTLDTPLKELLNLKYDILKKLNKEELVIKDSVNIVFNEITTNDYNVFIYCYLDVQEYADFLQAKERLNLEIMNLVNTHNLELAYTTQTIEIKNKV